MYVCKLIDINLDIKYKYLDNLLEHRQILL